MEFNYNDGGRSKEGFKGKVSDCVVRAIAILTEKPYLEIYNLVNKFGIEEYKRKNKQKSSSRTGVRKQTTRKIMKYLGFKWVPLMSIGSGCKVHLKKDELPKEDIIVQLSKHICCIKGGVINDLYDCSRNEKRCVYGYWIKSNEILR